MPRKLLSSEQKYHYSIKKTNNILRMYGSVNALRKICKKRYASDKTTNSKLADKTLRNYQNHTKATNSYESTIKTIGNPVPQEIISQDIFPQEM